ncbi:MAG TPA: L,D-transpeptidase family protein [Gaiellaceae bacterium]|nr:L,D-transpeptidase family protein [Gaiellaceae bacterium]
MRRALFVLVPLVAWPAAGHAVGGPSVTLKAPKATSYLHRIEFVGRVSPSRAVPRVRLMRGNTFVASAPVRRDGTYRIPVRLASPGPFHVAWRGVRSREISIRIRPRLQARLLGSAVTGAPLRLDASIVPAAAGRLRVQVIREGKVGFEARYLGRARVSLGTKDIGPLRIRLQTVPNPGYDALRRELRTTLRPASLSVGTTSPAVSLLARELARLHYAIPSLSSTFSYDFVQSVYAFQKVQGLERTGAVDAGFWTKLQQPRIPQARYNEPADHIEIDKTHQVLYIVRDGKIALISPVSTAGIAGYYTPEGRFAIYRKVVGYDPSPLGVLLNPMYFTGGYAIHGNPSVPPYPASHGCVRVPNFVIYRLFSSEPYGEAVYVYS